MTESIKLTTHGWLVTRSSSAAGEGILTGFWRRLRRARPSRHRERTLRVDQLPAEVLRDVDPALHDALTGLYSSWDGLDNRYRPPFY